MNKQLDEETLAILNNYGSLLNNTGGNDPAELLLDFYNDENLLATNIVRYLMAMAVLAQVILIKTLIREELLQ